MALFSKSKILNKVNPNKHTQQIQSPIIINFFLPTYFNKNNGTRTGKQFEALMAMFPIIPERSISSTDANIFDAYSRTTLPPVALLPIPIKIAFKIDFRISFDFQVRTFVLFAYSSTISVLFDSITYSSFIMNVHIIITTLHNIV